MPSPRLKDIRVGLLGWFSNSLSRRRVIQTLQGNFLAQSTAYLRPDILSRQNKTQAPQGTTYNPRRSRQKKNRAPSMRGFSFSQTD
jgi:hypothetical protein